MQLLMNCRAAAAGQGEQRDSTLLWSCTAQLRYPKASTIQALVDSPYASRSAKTQLDAQPDPLAFRMQVRQSSSEVASDWPRRPALSAISAKGNSRWPTDRYAVSTAYALDDELTASRKIVT
ncbi:hypothetical protein FQR65_LT20245 [Abscondita terminalis]|nr:hypothetical protein FQR65_LT20245 [Abscondita terminalis]